MSLAFYRNLVILNGAVPTAMLAWDAYRGQLGANGVNNALHITGILSLLFLFLSLIVTPLRQLTNWHSLIAYRRALGLYGFFYAVLHFAIYVAFDRMGSVSSTVAEILTRRFLTIGFIGLAIMMPLAITSTNGMIRWMGASRWKLLHRLAYLAAILGVVHYYMLVKSDVRQPLAFAAVVTSLLGFRAVKHYLDLRAKASRSSAKVSPKQVTASQPRFFTGSLRVAGIHHETPDVKTFRFANPQGGDIPFVHRPGQYMNLQLTINGQSVRRSYTIASSPTQRAYVELSIKRNPLGLASKHMHDSVQVGDLIKVGAPAGKFFFEGTGTSSVLLMAGGVGITPVMSMLRHLTDRAWPGRIYFVNAVRSPKDFIFRLELEQIARRFDNVQVITYYSQASPANDSQLVGTRWREFTGYLSVDSLQACVSGLETIPVFLCGPDAMMQSVCQTLRSLGVSAEQIATEEFVSPVGTPNTSDDSSEVPAGRDSNITFTRSAATIAVTSDQTVLDAAEAAGVELAWECRSGICGQCKVRCTEGKVHMTARDALSDAERAAGWILACQSRALQSNTVIDA